MSKWLLIEQFHVDVLVRKSIPDEEGEKIRRTLGGKAFRSGLENAVKGFFQRCLPKVRAKLSR